MSANQIHHAVHKIGEINNNKRIWIANQHIHKSFQIGDLLNIEYEKKSREVIVEKAEILSNHSISSRNSKSGKTPILDIKNSSLTELFKDIEKVEVLYFPNKIIIRATKNEISKSERANKKGRNTFELFAGGGTLSHVFSKYFNVVGGLEYDAKAFKLFELNHKNTLTILSSIEDIHPTDYPNNIDVVLVGTPCTFYSKGNVALTEALKCKHGEYTEKQLELLEQKSQNDALSFHSLNAIRAMNPKVVVYECVEEFSAHANLIRVVLGQMGYKITESVDEGEHTIRKRWSLVATMGEAINLDDLVPSPKITIDKLLETPIESRNWKKAEDIICFNRARGNKKVGNRSKVITSILKTSTFDTHGSRNIEPIMKHPSLDLYDKYTNKDIRNIHGLKGYELLDESSHGAKSANRLVLGNGVSNQFEYLAKRISNTLNEL